MMFHKKQCIFILTKWFLGQTVFAVCPLLFLQKKRLTIIILYGTMSYRTEVREFENERPAIFKLQVLFFEKNLMRMDFMNNNQGGFLISQVKHLSGRIFEKILLNAGVDAFNGAQGRILYVLWQDDEIPIVALSKKTGLAKTTLSSMLDRMESTGLIVRVFDKSDRRQIRISLTETARALSGEYDKVSREMNDIFYAGFSDTEIDEFENNLHRILINLERKS